MDSEPLFPLRGEDLIYLFLFSESRSLSESRADWFSGKLWGFLVIVCTITPDPRVPPSPPGFYADTAELQAWLASLYPWRHHPRPSMTLLYNWKFQDSVCFSTNPFIIYPKHSDVNTFILFPVPLPNDLLLQMSALSWLHEQSSPGWEGDLKGCAHKSQHISCV